MGLSPHRLAGFAAAWLLLLASAPARGQEARTVVVDSVHLHVGNVFTDQESEESWIYRTANSLRFQTREGVVRRELLFAAGDTVDVAVLEETERNLRALDLFRRVEVDTVRDGERLVARVSTRDAWSTLPVISGNIASDGTLTGRVGITERNLLGTGNFLSLAYRKGVDRDGGEIETYVHRLAGTQVDVGGGLAGFSDGRSAFWSIADPWRSQRDRLRVQLAGATADQRRLQYRVDSPTRRDTTEYRQHLYVQSLRVGIATVATARRVVRVEAVGRLRNERFLAEEDTGPVPDSVTADIGLFASFEEPRYREVAYLDGLNTQDVDLSIGATVGFRVAPEGWGYESDGIGPYVSVRGGTSLGKFLLRASVLASGLIDAGGLDSGRVLASTGAAFLGANRHATVLNLQGGILRAPAPGGEFDLGFSTAPRSYEPHSFVGTRALWGTLEHRWYVAPRILEQFGGALAAYFDFGGAWYVDQDPRWGSEIGIGIRTGSRLAPGVDSGRIDLGYRLGGDIDGSRFVLSIGTGFAFF